MREDRGVLVSLMVDGTVVRTTDLVQAVVAEVAGICAICGGTSEEDARNWCRFVVDGDGVKHAICGGRKRCCNGV